MTAERYANEAALDPPPESSWGKLLGLVPQGARVLDVGCGRGTFAAALRRLRGCRVTGIERNPAYAEDARARCDHLLVGDVAALLSTGSIAAEFDVVVAADVLEHLVDPAEVLRGLRTVLVPGGSLVASVPNVTHLSVAAELAAGRFPRRPEGLLDDTHLQFWGEAELLQLFERSGYAARVADRVSLDPRNTEFRTDVATIPDEALAYLERNPNATTYQFVVRAVPEAWAAPGDRGTAAAPARAGAAGGLVAAQQAELVELHARLATYHHALLASTARAAASRSPARARLAARRALRRAGELRVLYVADRDDAPFVYRCLHGAMQLREAGAIANIARVDAPDLLDRISSYSMIVLFRMPWSERVREVVDVARRRGAAVAFEVDDFVFDPAVEALMPFLPRMGPAAVAAYRRTFEDLGRTLDAADFCVVTTETLAARVRARGKPALVHPNLLSHEHVAIGRLVAPLRRALLRDPIVAYLSGSNTHDGDLASIAGGIAEALRRRPELSLLLVGHVEPPPALAASASRIYRLPYLDRRLYPWVMARCRAVLAPVEAVNDFTNSKSALKVFEAGAFGVPAVASPTLPYGAAIEHGVSGFLASAPEEWTAAIEVLCDRRASRRAGEAARELALSEHSPAAWHGALAHALLDRNGRAEGSAPPQPPLERTPLRERWRLARRAARVAFRRPGRRAAVPMEGAESLAREIAAIPRTGRELARGEEVVGLVLVDRDRTLLELEPAEGTTVLSAGRGGGNTVVCDDDDPRLDAAEIPLRRTLDTLVVEARARSAAPAVHLQVFWRAEGERRFADERSVRVQLDPGDAWTARAVTLPEPLRAGTRYAFQIHPLDAPGEAEIGVVALVAREALGAADVGRHQPPPGPKAPARVAGEPGTRAARVGDAILFILHASPWASRPGGTEHHVMDLVRALRLPRAVVAWPEGDAIVAAEVRGGDVASPSRQAFAFQGAPGLARSLSAYGALRRAVERFRIRAAHVHHLLSWPTDVARALADAEVPFVWTHHDYYAVCPNWNLYDYEADAPCACPPAASACLAAFSKVTGHLAGTDLEAERSHHREAMDRALAAAKAHVFPSAAAREVFERRLGAIGPRRVVIEHGHDARATAPRSPPGPRLRVALAGEVAYAMKGSERYLRLVASTRELPLEWHVFGDAQPFGFGERLRALALGDRLVLHGRYEREALPDLLRRHAIDLCVILPNWDETFSYVLSESLVAGVPALTSARGALRERIGACGAGRAVESVEDAARELGAICADRSRLETWAERARAYQHRPVSASAEEHRALYAGLGWLGARGAAPFDPLAAPLLGGSAVSP